jgi:hypothetical protein
MARADIPAGCSVTSGGVVLNDVHPRLLALLGILGPIAYSLFGKELVITSGKDTIHAASEEHKQGRAVCIHTSPIDAPDALLLVALVCHAGLSQPIRWGWDVRGPGDAHLHIEWYGA